MKTAEILKVSAGSVALSVALALSGGSVMAQGGGGQSGRPPAQTSPQPSIEVEEQELKKFASAVRALQQIKQSYSEELGQAGDKKKAQQIQAKMQQEMRQAIKEQGLSVERYTKIGKAVRKDPELNKKVAKLIQQQ